MAKKGARITWALDNKYIIVSGFSKQSERQIIIYNSKVNLCCELHVKYEIKSMFYSQSFVFPPSLREGYRN